MSEQERPSEQKLEKPVFLSQSRAKPGWFGLPLIRFIPFLGNTS